MRIGGKQGLSDPLSADGVACEGGHWIREPHQEGKPMQAIAKSGESGVRTTSDIIEQTMPDPVRRPLAGRLENPLSSKIRLDRQKPQRSTAP
jgi:hypothetical protein